MNREIKFRAWYIPSSKMMAWDQILLGMNNVMGYARQTFNDKDVVLMQYTGLKDKNGKEIYEGDILKLTYPNTNASLIIIKWNIAGFWSESKDSLNQIRVNFEFSEREVIGNIYENPELLK